MNELRSCIPVADGALKGGDTQKLGHLMDRCAEITIYSVERW
jgi:hypothetical protein